MNEQEALNLLEKFRNNQCTAAELSIIESWQIHGADTTKVPAGDINYDLLQQQIWSQVKPIKRRVPLYIWYVATTLVVSAGFYFIHQKPTLAQEIRPGGNVATLILSNGKKILLNSQTGSIAANITNNSTTGIVTYNTHPNENPQLNKISVPRGGQYQLVLEDGTKVYLNSVSTLQFKTNERRVTLSGEAYFEVAPDPKRPFFVTTKDQQIKVLGTHFNVSAYPDETIKTTLAEGSVLLTSLSSSSLKQLLKPGEQAELTSAGYRLKPVRSADFIAWKDGVFAFDETPLSEVINQLCRWYDLKADAIQPKILVSANLSRQLNLEETIKGLEFSNGIKITLSNDRRITVTEKQSTKTD